METEKTLIQAKPVTLSYDDQQEIITFVKEAWDKGVAARKKYMDHAKQCEDAYHCKMDPIESPELDWMSNICLPWAYDAADSWYAHIHSTTIPKQDQIFTISGRTQEDHPGADIMQKYIDYRFERNKFSQQLGKAYQDLARRNHCCLKVYWREDKTINYPWTDEPVMGIVPHPMTGEPIPGQVGSKKVRKPQEETVFNNVWIDVIDVKNFVMWPIRGDFSQTTRIHETYRHYEDLMASADKTNYFNLNELSLDDEKEVVDPKRREEQDLPKSPTGLNIKEAWIHRVKIEDDTVYRNYVATIVNNKTLIRFQPFPPGIPKSPFVFMALRPDKDCFYGWGLYSKGLGLLNAANKLFNGFIDEGQLTLHQVHKYYDDGVYNPNNVVRRPGAQVKVSREGMADNVVPMVDDKSKRPQAMQDLEMLKTEFESVTVPKVVKGMIEIGSDHTATEISQAQNNSNGKMHIDAYNINDYLLKPVIDLTYQAIYDRIQSDETVLQEIQQVTQPKDPNGNPMNQMPILPLPEVDIKIVGYQNVIRKQETLMAMGQVVPQFVNTPAAKYLNWPNLLEDTFQMADLDKDRLILDEQGRQQADQNEQEAQQGQQQQMQQQQDLMNQKEAATLQLQSQKQEQDFQIAQQKAEHEFLAKQATLELERAKFEFDAQMALRTADREDKMAKQAETAIDSTQVK